jgi:ribosomal protein RSM22 (predicted rRNA methylase)
MSAIVADIERMLATTLLSPQGAAQYEQGKVAQTELRIFAERIAQFSASYVACQSPAIRSEEDAAAYALYYLPINLVKVLHLLGKCPAEMRSRPLRVLDFGCGPGTASLALLESFPLPSVLTLVDRSSAMLALASKLLNTWSLKKGTAPLAFSTLQALEASQEYDLIFACNVLNELSHAEQKRLCDKLLSQLSTDGVLLLLEPALQRSTRQLMQLRDMLLLERQDLVPIFPCTRRDACPMLQASPTDWCHGTLQWDEPKLSRQLDEMLGFNKHRLKYSAFLFQKNGHVREGLRVITGAQRSKRGFESLVCGQEFYGTLSLPKRNQTERNSDFRSTESYDRINLEPLNQSGVIGSDSTIQLVLDV